MHMNISYINMCKLKKNRRRKELEKEREIGGDGVCGCSFGEPLKRTNDRIFFIFHKTWRIQDFKLGGCI